MVFFEMGIMVMLINFDFFDFFCFLVRFMVRCILGLFKFSFLVIFFEMKFVLELLFNIVRVLIKFLFLFLIFIF